MVAIRLSIQWSDSEVTPEQRLDSIWGDRGKMEYEPVAVFEGGSRGYVLVAHGQANGRLLDEHWVYEVMASLGGSQHCQIVCCHPGLVSQTYPELDVVGDWEITSTCRIEEDETGLSLVVLPAGW